MVLNRPVMCLYGSNELFSVYNNISLKIEPA